MLSNFKKETLKQHPVLKHSGTFFTPLQDFTGSTLIRLQQFCTVFVGTHPYCFEPLEQFELVNPVVLTPFNWLFTFATYSHAIPTMTAIFFFFFAFSKAISFSNFTIINLSIFKLIKNLFIVNVPNAFQNQDTFFLLYFIFVFILYHNLSGMLPFNYTTTSLIVTSFLLSITIFSFVCFKNLRQNGWFFFDHFLPTGVSLRGARWMIIIEIISFFMRVVSLGVRLFANLLSGHILLKVLIGFFLIGLASFLTNLNIFLFFSLVIYATILLLITALEIFISFLQSYTFVFLSIIYFSEVVKGIEKFNFSKTLKETVFIQKPNFLFNFGFLGFFFNINLETLNLLNNAPKKAQIYFQEAGSSLMEEILLFHEDVMCFLVFIVIFILYILIALVKYFYIDSEKPEVKEYIKNYNINHNSTLEIIWTLLPAFVLLIIVVPSFVLLYTSIGRLSKSPRIVIKIIGHQWYWTYEYVDFLGGSTTFDSYLVPADELIPGSLRNLEVTNRISLPIDTPIRILVTSADVIHSWAVPGLGIKIDACPGRLNEVIFTINKPGVYYGQCSEICGSNHSFMPIVIEAHAPSHYVAPEEVSTAPNFYESEEFLNTKESFSIYSLLTLEELTALHDYVHSPEFLEDAEANNGRTIFDDLHEIEAELKEALFKD